MFSTFLSLVLGLVALYVVVRVILPVRTPVLVKLLYSLVVFASAEKLVITQYVMGTMGAFLPWPVLMVTSSFQGFVLVLFMLTLLRDLIRLIFWLAHQVSGRCGRKSSSTGQFRRMSRFIPQSLMLTLFAALLSGYGMYEALRVPSVREVRMVIANLPPALDGLRVVQLSDLHIGPVFGQAWLENVVHRVNELKPDLTVITGDLVDGSPVRLRQAIAPLKEIQAKYGVFLSAGNHEYYAGFQLWVHEFRRMGLSVLLNSYVALDVKGTRLLVAGTTDSVASQMGEALPDPERIMGDITQAYGKGVTTLMLAHKPELALRSAKAGATVQLSGHTHGGLVLPLTPLVAHFNGGYVSGLYSVGNMALYVSRGSGMWGGLPLRLLVPSEITLITLTAKAAINKPSR